MKLTRRVLKQLIFEEMTAVGLEPMPNQMPPDMLQMPASPGEYSAVPPIAGDQLYKAMAREKK